jgi:hypothetical protein
MKLKYSFSSRGRLEDLLAGLHIPNHKDVCYYEKTTPIDQRELTGEGA